MYKVVAWTDGAFRIDFERRECSRTVTRSTQSVLMEALRLFDEAQRDGETERELAGARQGLRFRRRLRLPLSDSNAASRLPASRRSRGGACLRQDPACDGYTI